MKLIFLDIDGVLNSDDFYSHHSQRMNDSGYPLNYPFTEFDYKCVTILKDIISETGAKIVLSSSWRLDDNIDSILKIIGIDIFDKTPYIGNRSRGEEINEWFNRNNEKYDIESYCILDDSKDIMKKEKKYFVCCNASFGLTEEIKNNVINKLKTKREMQKILKVVQINDKRNQNLVLDEVIFSQIYLHGNIQSSFCYGDQVVVLNRNEFETYETVVGHKDDEPLTVKQIYFYGEIPCEVVGYPRKCVAYIWTAELGGLKVTKGLICDNDDEPSKEYAKKKMEEKTAIL